MSSQPPVAAAAMPVATASASASASASSTSPQPSPSSSPPHSSSSSDTVTCAPSAFSPSSGTASAHDSHHRAKVLERLVLNGKSSISTYIYMHAHTQNQRFLHAPPACLLVHAQFLRVKTTTIQARHCSSKRPSLASVPHSKSRDPDPHPDPHPD